MHIKFSLDTSNFLEKTGFASGCLQLCISCPKCFMSVCVGHMQREEDLNDVRE